MNRLGSQGIEERPPPFVPHHRLLRRIGAGSYGEVWIALDAMGKWCAVKVVHRDETDGGKACDQEFKGLKRYDDLAGGEVNLMPIRDVGRDRGGAYFYYAMELADDLTTRQPLPRLASAESLSSETMEMVERYRPWTLAEQLRREGRLPCQECIKYGMVLSSALEVLHGGRLVHRDIKPSNIVFVNGRPKLADIGLVTTMDATMMSLAGTSGFVPLYGAGSPSGDLFALGKVLYLMATGRAIHEFPAEPADLGQLDVAERRALAELRAVYDRACDVTPAERYASAGALREDLELLRGNESVIELRELRANKERLLVLAGRQRRRLRFLMLATGCLIIGVFAAWWLAGLSARATRQAVLAELEMRQLARMQNRKEGWSVADWQRAVRASAQGIDRVNVWRHAAATLSGLDARQVAHWRDVEATAALFVGDGRLVLAGHGTSPGLTITGLTHRSVLPVSGEGKLCRTPSGAVWLLQAESQACVVRETFTGELVASMPLQSGETVRTVAGPVLALSPDGELAAAALRDATGAGRTVVWRVKEARQLKELSGAATALAFAPDGRLLAIGEEGGMIRLYSTTSFELEATLGAGTSSKPITALAFGRSKRVRGDQPGEGSPWMLASGDAGVRICIWDLDRGIPQAFCLGSTWNVQSLAFHPEGEWLASAGRNGVLLWDPATGVRQLHLDRACGGDTRALAFDSKGDYLVAGSTAESQFGEISVWKLEPHRGIRRLHGLKACVRKVVLSSDGEWVAAISDEWVVGVWETRGGRLRALLEVPPGTLADSAVLAFAPQADQLAYAANGQVRLYSLRSNRLLATWTLGPGRDEGFRFESNGLLKLIRLEQSSADRHWSIYELSAGVQPRLQYRRPGESCAVDALFVPPGGNRFYGIGKATNTWQNLALGFSLETGEELWRQPLPFTNKWMRLIVDARGEWVALEDPTPAGDRPVFRGADGETAYRPTRVWLAVGSCSRTHASMADDSNTLFIENLAGTDTLPISLDGMWSKDTVTFSADERLIATGNNDGSVMVAEIEAVRARLRTLP